jgi:hypothetical protein
LITTKRIFDVIELSSKNLSLVEHECVKIKCNDFSLYVSAIYLVPDVGKSAYELFVEDIEAITDNSGLILILGDFNLPKVKVEGAETPLLKLDHLHKAYEIKMQICCCKFEVMEGGVKRYRFKLADCAAIVDKLDAVDWCTLFSGRGVNQCVDLFYETVWSCFETHVPTRNSGCEQKLPWMTRELTRLKNNKAKASKKSKDSKERCLKDDTIDNCECERLREKFVSLRDEYQQQHGRAYDDYRARIERGDQERSEDLFGCVDLKKKCVGYPSVMHFEGRLASGPEEICDLFAKFIQRTYTDDVWVPSDTGLEHVPDDPPFGALQFTSDKVESVLQDLDVNKGSGPDGIPSQNHYHFFFTGLWQPTGFSRQVEGVIRYSDIQER